MSLTAWADKADAVDTLLDLADQLRAQADQQAAALQIEALCVSLQTALAVESGEPWRMPSPLECRDQLAALLGPLAEITDALGFYGVAAKFRGLAEAARGEHAASIADTVLVGHWQAGQRNPAALAKARRALIAALESA